MAYIKDGKYYDSKDVEITKRQFLIYRMKRESSDFKDAVLRNFDKTDKD